MGLAEVLLIKVITVPGVNAPLVSPLSAIVALLLMITPLAITLSLLALLRFALKVQM